jgi:hypothetical protein
MPILARRVFLNRTEAECIRDRLERMHRPTFAEAADRSNTIYVLKWLEGTGDEFLIERKEPISAFTPISLFRENQSKEDLPDLADYTC